MQDIISRARFIDPFFEGCFNQIFLQSDKVLFAMDGAVGTGKTSEFTVRSAYNIACLVSPIRKGNRHVRESKWAFIRQSEQSAYNTVRGIFSEAIFSPEIVANNQDLITTRSQHPKELHIEHDLADGTALRMVIECHGFDNVQAFERLKTLEFLGIMIPEAQSVPFNIIETAIERCGRWRADTLTVKKEIDGKEYVLSGVSKLAIVLIDINIPTRPHALYTEWYDKKDRTGIPFVFFTPPSPVIPVPVERIKKKEALEKYPSSVFEGKKVLWLPNPKAYNFTRHFEEVDEEGKRIAWSGYTYWLNQVYRDDSAVRRYILGLPDLQGGASAIYKGFVKNDQTVRKREIDRGIPVIVGFDPGGHAAMILMQRLKDDYLHFFKEFIFTLEDNLSTREQFEDFLLPYCEENLVGQDIVVVPDPASSWLGKSRMSATTESALNIMQMLFNEANRRGKCRFRIQPPRVANQEEDVRIDSLKYFIDQHVISVDPSCEVFIDGLMGGYRRKVLKSGVVSMQIDKDDPSCDVVEAAQYPAVNILKDINRKRRQHASNKTHKTKQGSLARR